MEEKEGKDVSRRKRKHRRRWLGWLIAAAIMIGLLATLTFGFALAGPVLRPRIVRALERHFNSDVELHAFHVSLFPTFATGDGLALRLRRPGNPMMIAVRHFTIEGGMLGLGFLRDPIHVRRVVLEGLEIHVPLHQPASDATAQAPPGKPSIDFIVDEIDAGGTRLEILPVEPGKHSLVFQIKNLRLQSAGSHTAMTFQTVLINAKPPGEIVSHGTFGPWQKDDPGKTPVQGAYTFRNANLAVFHGISGHLSSDGRYNGKLERINVEGTTDTPDFMVDTGDHPLDLKTQFKAVVDGTNGDTTLDPVNARFLHSSVVARGGIIDQPGPLGKRVTLDVTVDHGRVEDILNLAVKSKSPVLRGDIAFHAKFDLPPGDAPIPDKLRLDGDFGIRASRFTNKEVERKISSLSTHASGKPDAPLDLGTASHFSGHFRLRDAVVSFSKLTFDVPGAAVLLKGSYGLRTEILDFRGELRMQATLSQSTTGVKSFFLRALDPFFKKKNTGTVLPIRITGTRSSPSIGLNLWHGKD
ncbi:MAG TPA: hypothetical protein VG675_02950 [Bryobacteraceae bacterium]|nr:hypothetical protein [Bryobacteraceae bacterium]